MSERIVGITYYILANIMLGNTVFMGLTSDIVGLISVLVAYGVVGTCMFLTARSMQVKWIETTASTKRMPCRSCGHFEEKKLEHWGDTLSILNGECKLGGKPTDYAEYGCNNQKDGVKLCEKYSHKDLVW